MNSSFSLLVFGPIAAGAADGVADGACAGFRNETPAGVGLGLAGGAAAGLAVTAGAAAGLAAIGNGAEGRVAGVLAADFADEATLATGCFGVTGTARVCVGEFVGVMARGTVTPGGDLGVGVWLATGTGVEAFVTGGVAATTRTGPVVVAAPTAFVLPVPMALRALFATAS